jgi:uncharacterized protein
VRGRLAWWLLAATLVTVTAARAAEVPYLSGRVVDEAEILTPAVRERLTAVLKAHEDAATNQIAVLTVPTIAPESIEDYAVRVFKAWKLGQAGKDNGVLVVVVPRDRKLRIEVGYGLEATLTDATAAGIIRDVMTPRFKAGDFDAGVGAGVDAIVGVLEGRGVPSPPAEPQAVRSGGNDFFDSPQLPWYSRILLGGFIFGILGLFTFLGIVTPGAGWFLYFFLIPFWAMFPVVVVGGKGTLAILATHLVGFPLAKLAVKRQGWYEKAARELKTKGRTSIGGFAMSAGGGFGSSGSSGGGGGFSGGGGSSGGGGASGSW